MTALNNLSLHRARVQVKTTCRRASVQLKHVPRNSLRRSGRAKKQVKGRFRNSHVNNVRTNLVSFTQPELVVLKRTIQHRCLSSVYTLHQELFCLSAKIPIMKSKTKGKEEERGRKERMNEHVFCAPVIGEEPNASRKL